MEQHFGRPSHSTPTADWTLSRGVLELSYTFCLFAMTSASTWVSEQTQSTWCRYSVSWSVRLHAILYTVVNTTFDPFSFTWGLCSCSSVFSLASVILWNTNIWLASILAQSKSNQYDIRPTLWSRLKNVLAYSKNSSNYRYKIILCLCSG